MISSLVICEVAVLVFAIDNSAHGHLELTRLA